MDSSVFAVAVTYNPDIELLNRQIISLIKQVKHIIIVDNGSRNCNNIGALIAKLSAAKITLIGNLANIGLGAAQNIGIEAARKAACDHILLLDQDSILDEGFVETLLKDEKRLLESGEKVGAIGPVYYNEQTMETYPITKYKGPFIDRIVPTDEPVIASFLIASGCLIRISVLMEVGLMNEGLFIDYIDVDWSFRTAKHGYKVYASPNARMRHNIGDSRASVMGRKISVHSPLRRYYLYRNSFFMIRQPYIPLGYKVREVTFNWLRFMVFLILSRDRWKYCKYSINGFFDGIKGVTGPCPHQFK